MSFLAKLTLGSTEYNVLTADYEISMPVDANNRPNGSATAGTLNMTLESNNKNDLVEWTSNRQKKNGQITFYRRDSQSSLKTVAFSDGYCISMREQFDANSADPMRVTVRISAGEIKINNAATLKKPWSAASAVAKEVAGAMGIDASSIMNEPSAKNADGGFSPAGAIPQEAAGMYQTAKTSMNQASEMKQEAEQGAHAAEQGAGSAKQAPGEAEKEISSFIP